MKLSIAHKRYSLIGCLILLGAGFGFGYYVKSLSAPSLVAVALRENSKNYKFINPLLLVYGNGELGSPEYKALESEIEDYRDGAIKDNRATDVSFYFRDLNTSRWTGVNEDDKYAPASMLKVAILMGYLKLSDIKPDIINEIYNYEPTEDLKLLYRPPKLLTIGPHNAGDLLKNMITESDNTAAIALFNKHADAVVKVSDDLKLPEVDKAVDFMSAKNYSVLWRVLYNSSYLSRSLSEQSIYLLTLTSFKDGLVAGVPSDAVVAHKFGEFTPVINGKVAGHELHDCGIVYPKNRNPYFICVMTKGADFDSLKTIISDISKITYNHIISNSYNSII